MQLQRPSVSRVKIRRWRKGFVKRLSRDAYCTEVGAEVRWLDRRSDCGARLWWIPRLKKMTKPGQTTGRNDPIASSDGRDLKSICCWISEVVESGNPGGRRRRAEGCVEVVRYRHGTKRSRKAGLPSSEG